jgi:alkylresorcinol/alkylpyrone synthase
VVSRNRAPDAAASSFKASASITDPGLRDALRFEQRGGMLRNILTLPVPKLAADHARRVLATPCSKPRKSRASASPQWVMHAGGRKVLEELQGRLALDDGGRSLEQPRSCASTAT